MSLGKFNLSNSSDKRQDLWRDNVKRFFRIVAVARRKEAQQCVKSGLPIDLGCKLVARQVFVLALGVNAALDFSKT